MLGLGVQGLAAKFGRTSGPGTPAPGDYHPLVCHMADVAAVALAMWDEVLPASSRRLLAQGWRIEEPAAREWVGLIAGLHDFGKASKQFQAKDRNSAARLQGLGLVPPTNPHDPGHGLRTTFLLPAALEALGVSTTVAQQVATVAGGHHGRFLTYDRRRDASSSALDERFDHDKWAALRNELSSAFAGLFDLASPPTTPLGPSAAMLLAGLVSVADWIGSIESVFEWDVEGGNDLAAYFAKARVAAHEVLTIDRWVPPLFGHEASFEALFDGKTPRPLQTAAIELAGSLDERSLVIVESPMGEGKTEAALYLAHRWEAQGARGSYIALPTQATANQMHERVLGFLHARAPGSDVNLVLAHGGAWNQPRLMPSDVHGDEPEGLGAVAAGEWFLSRKRALLAPYGVGTVDQALMAVLQVKHVFVRLFGLAGKAVVIDEVHAYDTYMTGLLERLLEWLAALGSPVVLLSATLPSSRRWRLLEAYAAGAGRALTGFEDRPYPRVTWSSSRETGTRHVEASERSTRSLGLKRLDAGVESILDELRAALRDGGCAAVICNTVGHAQVLYRALKDSGEFSGDEMGLFHARFTERHRQEIEKRCLRMFGPDASTRPPRYVLVATQVLEQSLDVDFDVMLTEFAPVDLLLQRSGRLQRHERAERKGGPPVLRLIGPALDASGLPQFDSGTKAVYDEHILLRTWFALRERTTVAVPGDVQGLVDFVYADQAWTPPEAPQALLKRWSETWREMESDRDREQALSRLPVIPEPSFIAEEFIEVCARQLELVEDDPTVAPSRRARTRLSELPSLELIWVDPDEEWRALHPVETASIAWLKDRSVTVVGNWTVAAAQELDFPASWQKVPALRFARLVLGRNRRLSRGPTLHLDDEFGVRFVFASKEATNEPD